ncbi:MAG: HAD-IC family P-type ATPase, partial [Actinomycetia bacterium]|nr:HAD-IC family P-type ATPase [Actinomycetes bacterium]
MKTAHNQPSGLTSQQAAELQREFGKNELSSVKKKSFLRKILGVLSEPMFLLLLAASLVYFLLGEPRDGAIMLVFIVGIISIETFQEWRTDKTLSALKSLSAPVATVIRDGAETKIPSVDLVPGDLLLVAEGDKIPADGTILKCSDLRVDESSLTGESVGVWKVVAGDGVGADAQVESQSAEEYWRRDYCYAGTLVTQGTATVQVDAIGASTEYGKIGTHIAEAPDRPTPLEKQVAKVVKISVVIAVVFCLLA